MLGQQVLICCGWYQLVSKDLLLCQITMEADSLLGTASHLTDLVGSLSARACPSGSREEAVQTGESREAGGSPQPSVFVYSGP